MNNVQLIGRLTDDPEAKVTGGGTKITSFRLAVNAARKDGHPLYIKVIAFGKTGENVAAYVPKGREVAVSGSLDLNEWTGDDGQKHSYVQVVANQVDFLRAAAEHGSGPAGASDE